MRAFLCLLALAGCASSDVVFDAGQSGEDTAPDLVAVPDLVALRAAPDLVAAPDLAPAGWSWTSVGPMGIAGPTGSAGVRSGKLNALVIDPTNPRVMLVAGGYGTSDEVPTSAGIFRSSDGGASWSPAVTGLVGANGLIAGTVNTLWMDPIQPSVVLALTELDGIFRSVDGGLTWSNVSSEPQGLRIAQVGTQLFATLPKGIYASDDDGVTWSLAQATPSKALVVTAIGKFAYAGTSDGTVFALQNGTWVNAGKAPGPIHALAVDPANAQLVYAAVPDGAFTPSLYASSDGGASFIKVANSGAQAIAFSAVVAHRLYSAGDGGMKWTIADGSANPTWTTAALVDDIRDVFMFANGSDDRCYGATDQGLVVSDTCSVAKSQLTYLGAGLSIHLMTDFAVSPDRQAWVAMMQDFGAANSTDGAATWSQTPLRGVGEDGYAAVNPGDPSLCYAFRSAFFTSTDGCATFTKTGSFPSSVAVAANVWAFDPTMATSFYVLSNPSGGKGTIYQTNDGGMTFAAVPWSFQAPNLIAISALSNQHLLVADGKTLSVSFDGGSTWTASTGLSTFDTLSVAVNPQSDSTVLAALLYQNSVTSWRSDDGGLSFTMAGTIVPNSAWLTHGGVAFGGIVYRPTGELAVVTTVNGAYLSSDDGASWQRLDTTTTTHHFTCAHWLDDELYLGTYGQGILGSVVPHD